MAVQDNSPNRTYIRWSNVKIINNGIYYPVSDGYTNFRYVYWSVNTPYELITSDTFPEYYDEIVFLNSSGLCRVYPSSNIVVDGNHMFDDISSISEHVSNGVLHMSISEKNALRNISDKTFEHTDMINSLGDSTIELQKMGAYLKSCIADVNDDILILGDLIATVESNLNLLDIRVVGINDKVEALSDIVNAMNETMSHIEGVVDTVNKDMSATMIRVDSIENRVLNLENQIGGVGV
ncbi:MAG: hypothetical protein ACRDDY_15520 [Clostridium sp.]|uniref:hypothetical protein n=1 Tax=Clostridium sp. TaxID=1506 RepID=UPI003EE7701E